MNRRISRLAADTLAAGAASAVILGAQCLRYSSPFIDAVTGLSPEGISLLYPWTYILLAPMSGLTDMWTFNSPQQHITWGITLVLAYWLARPFGSWRKAALFYPAYILSLVSFLAWGALFPRPTARIQIDDPDILAVDFHSHTTHSHDGRRFPPFYTPMRNIEWHRAQGFGAGFITDHNVVAGALEAKDASNSKPGYRSLAGTELSLHDSHILSIGNDTYVDNKKYSDGLEGIRRFLSESEVRYDSLSVLSLPEYWKHHWNRLEDFAGWGVDGLELENAAPKALAFPEASKRAVIALARKHNLFLVGVSDSHGWGSATYAWSLMKIPGHAAMSAEDLENAVIRRLKDGGFNAVRVLTRRKARPNGMLQLLLEPIVGLWVLFRTLTFPLALSWIAWIWGLRLFFRRKKAMS